jgi:DNA polymerase (family 10)
MSTENIGELEYAVNKNVMLSINPDAHTVEGFQDIKYGVLASQKGGLTAKNNLSSFSLKAFESFLSKRKIEKNLVAN